MTPSSGNGRNYRDLLAWQKAMELVVAVYHVTRRLPADERFGLVMQLRRCSVSVPSNIAEGQGRGSTGDFVRFLQIAHGSLREVETQLEICRQLEFLNDQDLVQPFAIAAETGRLIGGLIRAKRVK